MVLTSFVSRETAHLEPGESVRLAHLVQARGPGEPTIHLSESGQDLTLSDGETQEQLRSFEISRPEAAPPDENGSGWGIGASAFFDAGDRITALCLLDDGTVAVGTETGKLSQVISDGNRRWTADLEGPVHDIGSAPGESVLLAAGHGPASLTGLGPAGESLWTTKIEREPTPWPWWELPSPAPVQVAGGRSEGETLFAVGCGELQVRCFDSMGRERWLWRYYAGVPGRLRVTDGDGSGKHRIHVGGEILSCVSPCRILEPDGSLIAELTVEGWTSMLTALEFGEAEERRFIGCGANRGANLHLYEFRNDQWERSWLKRLGGEVTGISIFGNLDRVMVGTSQGFVLCFDLNGRQVWHRLFDQAIRHLAPLKEDVIVVDGSGALHRVNQLGEVEEMASLPAPCSIAATDPTGICFVCESEILRLSAQQTTVPLQTEKDTRS